MSDEAPEELTAREKLEASLALRAPTFSPDDRLEQRAAALDDHILETAHHDGELSQARFELRAHLWELQREWETVEGLEAHRGGRKTDTSIEDAKRQVRPDLWRGIQQGKWLDRQLTEEIERLERDFKKCSRSYTLRMGQ